jgi:hypothetical protein
VQAGREPQSSRCVSSRKLHKPASPCSCEQTSAATWDFPVRVSWWQNSLRPKFYDFVFYKKMTSVLFWFFSAFSHYRTVILDVSNDTDHPVYFYIKNKKEILM